MKTLKTLAAAFIAALLLTSVFLSVKAYAQTIAGAPAYQLPITVVSQKWFGTGAPGSQYPAQPGDWYYDTSTPNLYYCSASVTLYIPLVNGTGSPCTTVATGQWVVVPNPGSSAAIGTVSQALCHAKYSFAVDGGGAPGLITPASNCTIPANSILTGCTIDWVTAATGSTATATIGTTGTGGGTAILQASQTVGSGLSGLTQCVIVPQTIATQKKITTSGTVTLTSGTAALTGGVSEIWVSYLVSPE